MAFGPFRHRAWIVGQSPHGRFLGSLRRALVGLCGGVWGPPGGFPGGPRGVGASDDANQEPNQAPQIGARRPFFWFWGPAGEGREGVLYSYIQP